MKKVFIVTLSFCVLVGLVACIQHKAINPESRILMVNDKLYYGTTEIGPMGDAECVGGKIVSSVEEDTIPTENGQSNFECIGNAFTKDEGNGDIMVFIEDEWFWFYNKN